MSPSDSSSRHRWAFLTVAALLMAVSGWESGMPLFAWSARMVTFGCVLILLVAGTCWRRSRQPEASAPSGDPPSVGSRHHRGGLVWLAVLVAAASWDVLGLLTPPNAHHLTLSALVLAYRALHALVFACWLIVGWLLLATPIRRRERE